MSTKLTLIMIVSHIYNLDIVLNNLYSFTFKDWNLFLIVNSHELYKHLKEKYINLDIVEFDNNKCIFDLIIPFSTTLSSEYIAIINSYDIHSIERFSSQIIYMDFNKNKNICSCLEAPLNCHDTQKEMLLSRNKFISEEEITYATKSDFLALNIYTLLYRKSFLLSVSKYSSAFKLYTEVDLLLYFLRYEKISKVPEKLYYVNNITEISDYDYSIIEQKLSNFNKDNILDNQSYFNQIVNTKNYNLNIKSNFKYSIITILDSINIGGTETYILNLAIKLKESFIELCVITKKCLSNELFILYDIPIYIINLNDKSQLKNTINNIKNVKLIQIHMENDILLSPYLKEILNVPIVLTIHGIYYEKEILTKYLPYINKIIFVSNNCKKYYINSLIKSSFYDFTVIPNGIDSSYNHISKISLREQLGIPKDAFLIIYCSRLSSSKSKLALLFLKSFKKLAKKNNNLYAVIIGDGNYKLSLDLLMNKINNYLNDKKIYTLGNRFNILDYYSESDLIIGTGRVAIEAMSIGKAVVSLGLDFKANIINKKNIKKLINSNFGDHPSSNNIFFNKLTNRLTSILKSLIRSKNICERLGLWNKEFSRKNLTINNLIQYYKSTINTYNK